MRPLPDTRSRRQSDPAQILANKRLTNGFTKEHMTTRSQAKSQIKKYKSKAKNCITRNRKPIDHLNSSSNSSSSGSSPTRQNPYAFHYKTPASKCKATPFVTNTPLKRRREQNNNHEISEKLKYGKTKTINGEDTKNGSSNGRVKHIDRQKLGRKVYKHSAGVINQQQNHSSSINDSLHPNHNFKNERPRGRPRKEIPLDGAVAGSSATTTLVRDRAKAEAEKRAEKATKRRSALWVLNCEAESFLFGETAAEKHEVELPPLSPPPKKRRMRTNELSVLLKETPILGSKLRNPSSESGDSTGSPRKRVRKIQPRIAENESEDEERVHTELNLHSPSLPPEIECYSQSVRIQSILESLNLKFSFESIPNKEVWYRTFSRQEQTPSTFLSPHQSPIVLPYETKSLYRRSPQKLSRLPRKSPRCHASTLAILSSLKPRTRNSISAASPPASISALSLPSSSSASQSSTAVSGLVPPPLTSPKSKAAPIHSHSTRLSSSSTNPSTSTSLSHLPPLSVLTRSTSTGGSPSGALISPPGCSQNTAKNFEMTATQYLWDSIQFLSDPYVVQVLAEVPSHKRVLPKGANSSSNSNNSNLCCPIKHLSHRLDGIERRASLRSESSCVSGAGGIKLVPSPKVSPRNHINCTNINNNTTTTSNSFLNQNSHFSKSENRSPTFSPNSHHSQTVVTASNGNGRKSPRKSPVVLVSDILRPKSKRLICEEEMLFLGDGLPPLPSWPV